MIVLFSRHVLLSEWYFKGFLHKKGHRMYAAKLPHSVTPVHYHHFPFQATVPTHRSRVNSTPEGFDTSPEVLASSARFPSLVGTTLLLGGLR